MKGIELLQPVVVLVKVRVATPAPTAVTTPELVTVAMELLLLDHVPPVDGVTLEVAPAHTLRELEGCVALRMLDGISCLAIEGPW